MLVQSFWNDFFYLIHASSYDFRKQVKAHARACTGKRGYSLLRVTLISDRQRSSFTSCINEERINYQLQYISVHYIHAESSRRHMGETEISQPGGLKLNPFCKIVYIYIINVKINFVSCFLNDLQDRQVDS